MDEPVRIRLAKVDDASALSEIYWTCSAELPQSFMTRLGRAFLTQYHRVLLAEKHSLVLCAEDDSGITVGFASGSLDMREHLAALRRNRLALLLSALPALLRRPRLISGLLSRQRLASADEKDPAYIVTSGARLEFWGWLPGARAGAGAIVLLKAWLSLARLLGAQEIWFEVDGDHEPVEKIHRAMGARTVKEIVTPDGRARRIMQYAYPGHVKDAEGPL